MNFKQAFRRARDEINFWHWTYYHDFGMPDSCLVLWHDLHGHRESLRASPDDEDQSLDAAFERIAIEARLWETL